MDAHGISLDDAGPAGGWDESALEQASAEFLGRWHRLVSTTNWEKGRIICQWRQRLLAAGAPAALCSDEAWSRRVGNVSPQHVGRLRRTYERFGQVYAQYPGLYWSHFLAAIDWEDAEMWLEGAVQNGWSVAEMRRERWQTLATVGEPMPQEAEIVSAEPDEDLPSEEALIEPLDPRAQPVRPAESGPDMPSGDSPASEPLEGDGISGREQSSASSSEAFLAERPFEGVPPLPDDLQEAVDALKVVILRLKLVGWSGTSPEAVLAALDGLKALVTAPAA